MNRYAVGLVRYNAIPTIILILCVVAACSPTRGCVESNFELAPESRLPNWLQLPGGAKREDVSIELEYYGPPSPTTDNTVFIVKIKGHGRNTFTGRQWWHPRTKKQLDEYYATEPRPAYPHPSYVVIEVNGQLDVIEHRAYAEQNREPTRALFWMTDDQAILQEGRDSRSKAETLR